MSSWPRSQPARRKQLSTASTSSFDHWGSTDSDDNVELSQDIYRKLKQGGADLHQASRAVLRSGEGHVPARPLHQGRVPEVRRQGPVRRRMRELQLGLLADRSHRPVFDALGRDAGAQVRRSISSSGSPIPKCVAFLQEWTRSGTDAGARLQPKCSTRRRNGWAKAARARPTGTSRATRPISASRFRTRRVSISMSGSTRRSATWPA